MVASRKDMHHHDNRRDKAVETSQIMEELAKLVQMWEQMDMVVQAEWKLLLKSDISRLIRLSRIKEGLAERITSSERALRQNFSYVLPENPEKGLVERLEEIFGDKSSRRILLLLRRRDYFRQMASITNTRIIYWIEERSTYFQELSSILSGGFAREAPTYQQSAIKRKRPLSKSLMSPDAPGRNKGARDAKRGYASYEIQRKAISREDA